MSKGYIYKISNDINDKLYIGQTTKTIEERFAAHCRDSQRENAGCYNYHIYRAMRKYGIEHFHIELIEECSEKQLNRKEIYYIKKFNSYHNGYNSTLGGGGTRTIEIDENKVIEQYEKCKSMTQVAKEFHCSRSTLKMILLKNDIHIISNKEKGLTIKRYSLDNKLLETYETLGDAALWVLDNFQTSSNNTKNPKANMSSIIKNHILLAQPYMGFIWKTSDLSKKEFNGQKKRLIERNARCSLKKKMFPPQYVVEKDRCPYCGNPKLTTSARCIDCHNKYQKDLFNQIHNDRLSREDLKKLIRETPFTQIGAKFNVSDNTIRKWCKHYNLPYRAKDIYQYSDKEWKVV